MEKVEPLKSFWEGRNRQWSKDRALLMQQYRARIMPFEQIISNEASTNHAAAVAILGGKEPLFRLPITMEQEPGENPKETPKHNKAERLLYGMYREWDKRWRLAGHGPWLLDFLHYACLGSVSGLAHIVKVRGRPPEFYCPLFDPMTVFPAYGEDGLLAVARVYKTTPEHARSIATQQGWDVSLVEGKADELEIVNFWEMGIEKDDENPDLPYNEVMMGGKIMKERQPHDEFSRIPVFIAPMNGIPWRGFENPYFVNSSPAMEPAGDWTANWGRPVFWPGRQLYRDMDRLLGYEMERSRRSAHQQYIAKTQEGRPLIEGSVADLEVVTVNATENEEFGRLDNTPRQQDDKALLDQIFSMLQRSGLNRFALGDLNLEIAGVTYERVAAAARYVLEPYADGSSSVLSDIMMHMLEQVRRLRINTIKLETRTDSLGADFGYLLEEFKREDIPDTTYVEVRLPMLIPDDQLRRATIARQLIPGNVELADRRYVAENVMEIQDWDAMRLRIKDDAVEGHPAMVMLDMIAAARRKRDQWAATPGMEGVASEMDTVLEMMRQAFAQAFAPREQPASTLQAKESAPSPEVQPSEERGTSSSDMEMMTGEPSAGQNGGGQASVAKRLSDELRARGRR